MIERRFHRLPLRVPLYVSVGGGRLFEKAVAIESRDISGGGLSFETRRKIPVDVRSKIVVGGLEGLPQAALIEGRVVYRRAKAARVGEDVDARYTIGVEFVDFVNTTREEILERISAWQETAIERRRPNGL